MSLLKRKLARSLAHGIKRSSNVLRTLETLATEVEEQDWPQYRAYSEIPGPKPIPLLGNTWRFLPFIGISHQIPAISYFSYVSHLHRDTKRNPSSLNLKINSWTRLAMAFNDF